MKDSYFDTVVPQGFLLAAALSVDKEGRSDRAKAVSQAQIDRANDKLEFAQQLARGNIQEIKVNGDPFNQRRGVITRMFGPKAGNFFFGNQG